MIYRIAKPSDLNQISDLFYKVRDTYSVGYFAKMGKCFIREYYRQILDDPYEYVICAEDETGMIRGFCSGTLDIQKQFVRMRKNKWRMGLAAIPTFISKPSMVKETLTRYKATKCDESETYIPQSGARGEYWLWDAEYGHGLENAVLYEAQLKILYALGVKILNFEVDEVNEKVLKFVLRNNAIETRRITMPDGRIRVLLYYNLQERYSRRKTNK